MPQKKFYPVMYNIFNLTRTHLVLMNIARSKINSILFITLSNLGDIILTTPVLEKLYDEFPGAKIDVITGAPGADIFSPHAAAGEVIVYNKRLSVLRRLRQSIDLRRKKYDLVVDLKNSIIPYIIGARFKVGLFTGSAAARESRGTVVQHKKQEHLSKLSGLGIDIVSETRFFIPSTEEEKNYASGIVDSEESTKVVVINPGAKSHLKRWDVKKYAELSDRLITELNCRVLITGNEDDREIIQHFLSEAMEPVTNLYKKTSIGALSELMRRAALVVTNDSAPLHVASAVNAPTIAIFGPSDDRKYGPVAEESIVIKPNVSCRPCEKALCDIGPDEGCISRVEVEEVFQAAKKML